LEKFRTGFPADWKELLNNEVTLKKPSPLAESSARIESKSSVVLLHLQPTVEQDTLDVQPSTKEASEQGVPFGIKSDHAVSNSTKQEIDGPQDIDAELKNDIGTTPHQLYINENQNAHGQDRVEEKQHTEKEEKNKESNNENKKAEESGAIAEECQKEAMKETTEKAEHKDEGKHKREDSKESQKLHERSRSEGKGKNKKKT